MTAERRSFPAAAVLLTCAAALYGAYLVRQALLPFVLSCALAYVVNPVIDLVETRGARRFHIVLGFYLLVGLLLALTVQHFTPVVSEEFARLQADAPGYLSRFQKLVAELQRYAVRRLPRTGLPLEHLTAQAYGSVVEQFQRLPSFLLGLFPLLSLLFLVPFITFFLLLDGPRIITALVQAAPSRYVEQALHLISEIDSSLGRYLRGIFIVALAITAASYVGLLLMGVDGALTIALLSGVSSFVPYLGAIVGALVGGTAAFIQFGTFAAGLKVVALFFGIRLADEALLQPIIASQSVHLHPMIFLLSLMIGGEVFGFIGLVFAVPAACILKALLKVGWEWYVSEARLKGQESHACAGVPYT